MPHLKTRADFHTNEHVAVLVPRCPVSGGPIRRIVTGPLC